MPFVLSAILLDTSSCTTTC